MTLQHDDEDYHDPRSDEDLRPTVRASKRNQKSDFWIKKWLALHMSSNSKKQKRLNPTAAKIVVSLKIPTIILINI
jgi:hypothetical protein